MNRARLYTLLTETAELDGYNEVDNNTSVLNYHNRLGNFIHIHDELERPGFFAEELEGLHQEGSMSGFQYEFLNQFWFENGIYERIRYPQEGVSVEELQQPELSDENPQQAELSHPSPQQVGLSDAELQQGELLNEELVQAGFVSDEEHEQEGLPNEEFYQEGLSYELFYQEGLSDEELQNIQATQINMQQVDDMARCSVCLTSFKEGETVSKLPCNHLFHTECVLQWLSENRTCPNCRSDVGN